MIKSVFYSVLISSVFLVSCTQQTSSSVSPSPVSHSTPPSHSEARITLYDFATSEALQKETYNNAKNTAFLDLSSVDLGYISCKDTIDNRKVMIQITYPDHTVYQYPLVSKDYKAFPLTGGNGTYSVRILEHIKDKQYSVALYREFDVVIKDEFTPYIRPNQYVDYTEDSQAVLLARTFSEESSSDLDFVQRVFTYITTNITYDTQLAKNIPPNYIPDVDATLESKKGICFDYASLTTSMLRSQNIPTKLQVGYAGEVYHAWISVYLDQYGWINNIIEFKGSDWTLMDPTLSSSNDLKAVQQYIGDGTNYSLKYNY